MATNRWAKRRRKLAGFFNRFFSAVALRYTGWNTQRLKNMIRTKHVARLHVGCGDVLLKDWLNIRYEIREEYGRLKQKNGAVLLNYNLLKPWPVEDNSVDYIAGSHFMEHLDLNHGIRFLQAAFRALKNGGVIRLSCPDMELYARNYLERNMEFFNHSLIREWCAFSNAKTPGEIFVAKAYDSGGAHKWFYDYESMVHILQQAGFKEVKRCSRLEGRVPDLEFLEPPERELETLYVEAVKP